MKYIILLTMSMISITCCAFYGEYRHHHGYKYAYQEIDYKLNEIIKDGKKAPTIEGLTPQFYPRKGRGIIIEKQMTKSTIAGAGATVKQTRRK